MSEKTEEEEVVSSKTRRNISRSLSWLLRHGIKKCGLKVRDDGYVKLDDVLATTHKRVRKNFEIATKDLIRDIVKRCPKQRFRIEFFDGVEYIRANQGHSIRGVISDEKLLKRIKTPIKTCIHGTFSEAWSKIKKSGGLSKMTRNHIHFAKGLPGDDRVISGMRRTCDVFIYVNVGKCLESDIPFFESANGVLLSPGNEKGVIPISMFEKVVSRIDGRSLS